MEDDESKGHNTVSASQARSEQSNSGRTEKEQKHHHADTGTVMQNSGLYAQWRDWFQGWTTVSFLWRLLFFYQPPLRKLYKNVVWKATMYLYAIKQIYCRHSMASGIFLPISLIQRKRPFPVQMYRKRPEIKGFHGSIGSSGRAVKAFFLYTVVIVVTACKVTPPPICRKRNN